VPITIRAHHYPRLIYYFKYSNRIRQKQHISIKNSIKIWEPSMPANR